MSLSLHIISSRCRWRCGPPLRPLRGRQAEGGQEKEMEEKDAQLGRQRYMAIQTLVFYPSLIGKLSTVNSALKLDIDPTISAPPSPLSPSPPRWLWDCTFSHLVVPFLSFSPPLSSSFSLSLLRFPSWYSCHLFFTSFILLSTTFELTVSINLTC